jgi:predicted DNA-binding transcriptional regulator AlpA
MNMVQTLAQSASPQPATRRLIDAAAFRALLNNMSPSAFDKLKAQNRFPRHLSVSRRTHLWDQEVVMRWIDAGCPTREAFEAMERGRSSA